jgi:hypothetical protein
MLNQHNFRPTPTNPHKEPTRSAGRLGPSFSWSLPSRFLRWFWVIPPRLFSLGSVLGGLYKEEESPPFNTLPFGSTPSLEDVVLNSKAA